MKINQTELCPTPVQQLKRDRNIVVVGVGRGGGSGRNSRARIPHEGKSVKAGNCHQKEKPTSGSDARAIYLPKAKPPTGPPHHIPTPATIPANPSATTTKRLHQAKIRARSANSNTCKRRILHPRSKPAGAKFRPSNNLPPPPSSSSSSNIRPNPIRSPTDSPKHLAIPPSEKRSGSGNGKGNSSNSRRIFTAEFKRTVVNAFAHDPECVGNQRATARKFRIHRRQVQKWIQQRSHIQVKSSDAACESAAVAARSTKPPLKSSSPRSSSSVMANAINTLLSLRDAVRIKAPWSPQSGSTPQGGNISVAALNLGLLSNSASMLHDLDPSPPQASTPTGNSKSGNRSDSGHRSPRISPQSATTMSPSTRSQNNVHYTGVNSNGVNSNSSNNMSGDHDLISPSELIDELSYLYPQEDFTLLRKACLKNEITLTKLTSRLSFGYPPNLTPSPSASGPGSNGNGGGGLKDDFMTQQTLQLIKQQNEYVQMLQQSGVSLPVFPGDMASSLNLASLTGESHSSSKYSTWFHPLAQAAAAAAAAGMALPTASNNNGGNTNGSSGGGKKKSSTSDHMFLSPKTPALSSSSKPKTVAAALAASRHSPNMIGSLSGLGNGSGKGKKPVLPRKRQQRPKSSTITRPSLVMTDDDIDPSSMVETTTTIPADYGMDLSTSSTGSNSRGADGDVMTATGGKIRIKSEPFLYSNNNNSILDNAHEESGVELKSNGHNLLNAASLTLENYLRNVMPKKSPTTNSPTSNENVTPEPAALSESDKKKQLVLEAFNDDEEVAGDARGVARKFGLNIRVVLKWLREGPSKSLPALPILSLHKSNGGIQPILANVSDLGVDHSLLTNGDSHGSAHVQKKNLPNKRKNTKPNQICDFQDDDLPDDSDTIPLDMVVPIKKRRVSNSNASS